MDDPGDWKSTRAELGWWARTSAGEFVQDALFWLAVVAVVVVPAAIGYAVAGEDGILPGAAVGVGICALGVLWVLFTGVRDLRRKWRSRGGRGQAG